MRVMAGLLTSLNCKDEHHLLVGISGLTYSRVQTILANDAVPIIITHSSDSEISQNLSELIKENNIAVFERDFDVETDLLTLGRPKVGSIVDRVFVNLSQAYYDLKVRIFQKCQVYRIPINTTESPDLSTFALLSTYEDGDFQLGITTSGKGCKLANRIKREIVSNLPNDLGKICDRVGRLRSRIQEEDRLKLSDLYKSEYEEFLSLELGEHEEDSVQSARFNMFISEFNMSESEKRLQRSRWLSQVVEYYPFEKLASLSINDLSTAYTNSTDEDETSGSKAKPEREASKSPDNCEEQNNSHSTAIESKGHSRNRALKGSISLVGSGPGSISLLTLGALSEINTADIVLADKLVPQQVLDLIPTKTEKFIARKFPGNAEAAQEELLNLGLRHLRDGKKVVRLKQGDPYIFGRGGEEFLFFREHGYVPKVVAGITSALSSTVSSNIPATQRDVADQVLICTGTGRKGVLPNLPEFVPTRTTIFLMALHRVASLVPALIAKGWDPRVRATVVERSTCPDQRVVRTTLADLCDAVEAVGSRPPGLIVLGSACDALNGELTERWEVSEGYSDARKESILSILETVKEHSE